MQKFLKICIPFMGESQAGGPMKWHPAQVLEGWATIEEL